MEPLTQFAIEFPAQAAASGPVTVLLDVQPNLKDVAQVYWLGYSVEFGNAAPASAIKVQFDSSVGQLMPVYYGLATATTTPTANQQNNALIFPQSTGASQQVFYNFPYVLIAKPQGFIQRIEATVGTPGGAGVTFTRLVLHLGVTTKGADFGVTRPSDGWRWSVSSYITK